MQRMDRWVSTGLCLFALLILPARGFGEEPTSPALYDCGKPICSEWAPKGENTCRSCKTAQCKKQNGNELLVGEKNASECYPGHSPAPEEEPRV